MIKEGIIKIVNKEDLSYDEAYTVMNEIMITVGQPMAAPSFLFQFVRTLTLLLTLSVL